MQPNSKTGRRLTALPVALRHNGPWRYTTVEYMMGRGTACSSRGADAGCRCQSMPQRPQRFNITAHRDQWSVRRPEESLRNAGSRASHSQPAIPGERSAPFFHEDVTPPPSMQPQPVRRRDLGGEEERGERSFGMCGPLLRCAGPTPASSLRPAQIRSHLALVAWSWSLFVVVVFVFVAVSPLSPLSPLDASTSTFLLAFPWRFSWRST